MIDTKQLAYMRSFVGDMLPDIAIIKTTSFVTDERGGYSESLTASGTVACRIDPMNDQNQLTYASGGEKLKRKFIVTLPHDAVITSKSKLVVNEVAYNIVALYDAHSWNVSVRAEIVED